MYVNICSIKVRKFYIFNFILNFKFYISILIINKLQWKRLISNKRKLINRYIVILPT